MSKPGGTWFKMPQWIFEHHLWSHLSLSEKSILPVVMKYANYNTNKGYCYASVQTMSDEAGISPRAAGTALRSLAAKQLIGRVRRGGGGRYRCVTYRVDPLLRPVESGTGGQTKEATVAYVEPTKEATVADVKPLKSANADIKPRQPLPTTLDSDIEYVPDEAQQGPAPTPGERFAQYFQRTFFPPKTQGADISKTA